MVCFVVQVERVSSVSVPATDRCMERTVRSPVIARTAAPVTLSTEPVPALLDLRERTAKANVCKEDTDSTADTSVIAMNKTR